MSVEKQSKIGFESSVPILRGWDTDERKKAFERAVAGEDLWLDIPSESEMGSIYLRFNNGEMVAQIHGSGGEDTLQYARFTDGRSAELLDRLDAINWVDGLLVDAH